MALDRTLTAVQGYLELNMPDEAMDELMKLSETELLYEEPMQLFLVGLMQLHRWEEAVHYAGLMRRKYPELNAGYLHGAFCLHELGRTQEAKDVLLEAPVSLAIEPTYQYNLACYEAVLGNRDEAMRHLHLCFDLDGSFRELAKIDPDLERVREIL